MSGTPERFRSIQVIEAFSLSVALVEFDTKVKPLAEKQNLSDATGYGDVSRKAKQPSGQCLSKPSLVRTAGAAVMTAA